MTKAEKQSQQQEASFEAAELNDAEQANVTGGMEMPPEMQKRCPYGVNGKIDKRHLTQADRMLLLCL